MSAVNGKPDALERAGIVGGGIMGTGIAEVCAKTGLDLILVEVNEAVAETARARVQHSLDPAVRGDKLGAEAAAQALARLRCVDDFDSLADRQIVIEAVVEDRDVKLNVFDRLRRVVKHHEAILASNTSSIPIVELATATGDRADHVLGLTLQPRSRALAGRDHPVAVDRRRRRCPRARLPPTNSARSRSSHPIAPASWSTRC